MNETTCTHERIEWYENGNQGGFSVFVKFCENCNTVLNPEIEYPSELKAQEENERN